MSENPVSFNRIFDVGEPSAVSDALPPKQLVEVKVLVLTAHFSSALEVGLLLTLLLLLVVFRIVEGLFVDVEAFESLEGVGQVVVVSNLFLALQHTFKFKIVI